jgi:hypothetical protein
VADLSSVVLSLSCVRRGGDNPSFEWKWKQVEAPWASGRPYIIATQGCNGRPGLEVYPAQFTATQRSGALNGSIANGSFRPNDYLAVTASSMRESASAGLHVASRLAWTRYALL